MHEEGLAAADAIENDYLRAQILDMLGLDAAMIGDLTGAREQHAAAAELHTQLLDYEGSAYGLSGLANVALAQGRAQAAARLIAASAHACEVIGAALWPAMQEPADRLAAAVRSELGPASFAAASAEGARMRIADAFGHGLAATAVGTTLDPFPEWSSNLRPAA